jgi:hypothetical protein
MPEPCLGPSSLPSRSNLGASVNVVGSSLGSGDRDERYGERRSGMDNGRRHGIRLDSRHLGPHPRSAGVGKISTLEVIHQAFTGGETVQDLNSFWNRSARCYALTAVLVIDR